MRQLLVLLLAVVACAPSLVLPPITPPAAEGEPGPSGGVTVGAVPTDAPRVIIEQDSASGYTRRLVTTHRGKYSGWVQQPQITFFAVTAGRAPPRSLPASIALVFRTMEPEVLSGPRLILSCAGQADTVPLARASVVTPTGNTHSHFLTYSLPVTRVAAFAGCQEGSLQVGQTQTHFTLAQLGGLRALLLALGATPAAGGT